MKITVQMIIMNQCNHACSSAILVAPVCRFSCRTPGPPGKSFTAQAAVDSQVPIMSRLDASILFNLFIVFS